MFCNFIKLKVNISCNFIGKKESKIEIIQIGSVGYPKMLEQIKNPPKRLYLEGNIDLLKTDIISIVGSRKCSENGKYIAEIFSKGLSVQNISIASGLAERYRYCCTCFYIRMWW